MKTRIYPVEYVEALTKLAAAGQTLAVEIDRTGPHEPSVQVVLDRTKRTAEAYEEVVQRVVYGAENLAAHITAEKSIEAIAEVGQ